MKTVEKSFMTQNSSGRNKMDITFKKLTTPSHEIAAVLDKWENNPALIPFIRPNPTEEALEKREPLTVEFLQQRLKYNQMYLIYLNDQLVGEITYQVDPPQLYKKETGTAWIGITIGEETARGIGVGTQAMQYLEEQIKAQGLHRIELGVFEFNTNAIKLYKKTGYKEIARLDDFTYYQGKMWQDIRMEKHLD